ncbi:hypothetical protein CK215_16990 [Mesorhizobium sp. WSM3864]|uniref:hypothetical protein n=1 Tax=Mesorhizobium sp. WSM3864 TaxID=2029404 RepID=UPI000BAEF5A9|nr:hypothetical protein [Mesorhizobium sp. WSM3864]PBB91402.1 hypothetical protein CK215_16990 [Mesorhizobium sp. WSM3864]
MRRVLLPLILTVVVLLACYWAFAYVQSSWPTAPLKRTPEQNQGGNAPQDTSPAAGIEKDPQGSNKMPGNQ